MVALLAAQCAANMLPEMLFAIFYHYCGGAKGCRSCIDVFQCGGGYPGDLTLSPAFGSPLLAPHTP